MEELIKDITHTVGGYPIKDLRYNKRDNLFIGRVLDPVCGNTKLHNGFVTVCWRKNGKVDNRYGGSKRSDLEIKFI
jgi:hypothetical protein